MVIGNDRWSQIQPGVIATDVEIDQPGRHVEAGNIDSFLGFGARNVAVQTSDLAVQNGDIHLLIDAVGPIDHMPALEQGVVLGS